MDIKNRKISELIPAEYNPRYITDEAFEQLKASIQRFEAVEPVLVNMHPDRENIIVSGHMRIRAAKSLGLDMFPCVELNLDPDKERELNIRMNKNTGAWDWDELANNFNVEELKDWGFSDDELFGNFDTEEAEAEEDNYKIPDKIETDIVLGDLIEIGRHRLLCGDSTDSDQVAKLMDGKKADMVFTDPPYNIDYQGVSDSRKVKNDKMSDEDSVSFLSSALNYGELVYYVCCSWQYYHLFRKALENNNIPLKAVIIWNKVNPAQNLDKYYKQHEFILYSGPFGGENTIRGDVWEKKREQNTAHPTMKPIELISMAIKDNPLKQNIVDPFVGSGSTMVAAHKVDRKCYGMEIDPKYCQVIIDRMQKLDDTLEIKINGDPYGV